MVQENKTIKMLNRIFGDGVFANDEVNSGRQIELDIAKGFAIIFMIWVHTAETFNSGTGAGYAVVDNFLGGPFAAPVFMVCMGIGMRYSRKQDAKDFAMRGVDLLIIGLLLNIFRYVLPLLIMYAASGDKLYLNTYTFMFGVDIMEFAGLAFLFFALAKKFGWSDRLMLVIAAVASVLGAILRWKATGNMYVDQWLGYIWGNEDAQTYFPFLNWIIFPVFGYIFGKYFRHCADKKTFYMKASTVCGVLGLGYIILAYVMKFGMYGENGYYYFLGPVDTTAVLMLVVGILGFDFTLLRFADTAPFRALRDMSSNINTVYCIQWTLIGTSGILLTSIFPENGLSFLPMTLLAAVFVTISGTVAHWYKKHQFLRNRTARIIMASLLVIVMVISLIGQAKADPIPLDDEDYFSQTVTVSGNTGDGSLCSPVFFDCVYQNEMEGSGYEPVSVLV